MSDPEQMLQLKCACGGDALCGSAYENDDPRNIKYWTFCDNCGIRTGDCTNDRASLMLWIDSMLKIKENQKQ